MKATLKPLVSQLAAGLIAACVTPAWAQSGSYDLEYRVRIGAGDTAEVSLHVAQDGRELRRLRLPSPDPEFEGFANDGGELVREGDDWVWHVADAGGSLHWQAKLERRRADGSVDALRRDRWMLLRAEDLFPAMASASRPGASATTRMVFELPDDWSVVTPYPGTDATFTVDDADRRFDHPDGWIVAGDIGVRYDKIANTTIAVAAPRNQSARRLDIMAFLNWHLALVRDLLPAFPDRLLVAQADDPFFRGGLSAPNSLFLHSDRPLLSGNGTSTLLHELVHVGLGRSAGPDEDWIVEGLAEYYSLTLLYRAGTVTRRRHRNTLRDLRQWGSDVTSLRSDRSTGPVTARAATLFSALDAELRRRSGGTYSLDDVVRRLCAGQGPVTLEELRSHVRELLGRSADALSDAALPGYS